MRDTDADWRHLGETDPFFGVVTDPKFHADAITPEAIDDFYETGRRDVWGIVDMVTRLAGAPGPRALDIGCGVGRLTEAMADLGYEVTGYDISPGMLDKAGARSGGRVNYVDQIPSEPFDWVNSFIVLQHIPPEADRADGRRAGVRRRVKPAPAFRRGSGGGDWPQRGGSACNLAAGYDRDVYLRSHRRLQPVVGQGDQTPEP